MRPIKYIQAGLLACLCLACSDDVIVRDATVKSITVNSEAFGLDNSSTKASYTVDPSRGFVLSWTEGDTIGIYPVGGDQVAFPISGTSGTSAQFDGGSWAVRSNYSYAAYFPFSTRYYTKDMTELPVTYLGQYQTGDNSTDGLGRFDYQASEATVPEDDGNVSITLHHLGCFVRLQLTMPVADTYKSLTLSSDNAMFTTTGTMDLSAETPVINATTQSSYIRMSLQDISTVSANQTLTFYMMLGPADMGSSTLTAIVEGTKNSAYYATLSGKDMKVGKAYSYTSVCSMGTYVSSEDAGWDDETHEYVDLGLSVLWATCNVGAISPNQSGDLFAWGETQPYYIWRDPMIWKEGKENGYSWASYFDNPSGDGKSFIKYWPDGKIYLDLEDDAANVNWGDDWRLPRFEELGDLRSKCSWAWYPDGNVEFGVSGYKVTSNVAGYTDKFIFLPMESNDEVPYYWTNAQVRESEDRGWSLTGAGRSYWLNEDKAYKYLGCQVRPVRPVPLLTFELDETSLELVKGMKVWLKESYTPANATSYETVWSSSDETVALVNQNGEVGAISAGTCTITATRGSLSATCAVTVTDIEPEFVDLGLSVKWATFNVGSPSTVDWGEHYAWGETESYYSNEIDGFEKKRADKPDGYAWTSYFDNPTADGYTFTKYNNNGGLTELASVDDVANAKWGGNWRIPTKAEFQELIDGCDWELLDGLHYIDILDYLSYFKVKSKVSDNYIIIPAATNPRNGWAMTGGSSVACYWTSTLDENSSDKAYGVVVDNSPSNENGTVEIVSESRCYGLSVRPVCE